MTLDDLVHVGAALGSGGLGVSSLIAAGAYALRKRSDALAARANADRVEAETRAAAEERVTAMLGSMRTDLDAAGRRLDECHERGERIERESREREEACEARTREALAKVAELSARMDRLTPQPMRAVSDAVKETA
jgi:hypothetical protein